MNVLESVGSGRRRYHCKDPDDLCLGLLADTGDVASVPHTLEDGEPTTVARRVLVCTRCGDKGLGDVINTSHSFHDAHRQTWDAETFGE